jgi:hypothetical protein
MKRDSNNLRKGIYISVLLMLLYIVSINQTNTNLNNEGTENFSDVHRLPKMSGPEINITTPENKTYMTPMSGYYPATYGFENDKNGLSPYDWVDTCEANAYAQVVDSTGTHKKVIELSSTSGSASSVNLENIFVAQNTGTLELWMMKSSANENGPAVIFIYGAAVQTLITLMIDDDAKENIEYIAPSGVYTDIGYSNYSDDKWFHIRIEWNCISDTYSIWIDNIQYLNNTGFQNARTDTAAVSIKLYSYDSSNPALYYIDAVGYSWDPNYNVGDNRNEGLLLSFDNSTTLDWIGYSLDGQTNKTILGNSSIPLSAEGLHSIQVFGNDTGGTDYQSDIRYFSVHPINVITPENKTYIEPMSGYYPATYGFENDLDGSDPMKWNVVEAGTSTTDIISGIDGHNKTIYGQDTDGNVAGASNDFQSQQNGTVEFWFRKDTSGTDKIVDIDLREGSNERIYLETFGAGQNYFQRYDGSPSTWKQIAPCDDDTWYHIRIDFECEGNGYMGLSNDTYYIYINGTQYGPYPFYSNSSSISQLYFHTWGAHTNVDFWIDAVGYTWDPNYNIGDNLNEGLLLSFENSTNLEWMGYSLDAQANRTIFGNTTIPMPSNGLHTIQVFGNNTLGTMEQSQLRYFTVLQDQDAPSIEGPSSDLYIEQSSPYILQWNITEINNGTYEIRLNGSIVAPSTAFTHWSNVSIAVDTSTVGDWNYTIIATDPSSNVGTHTVIVHVFDITGPTITGPGTDITLDQFSFYDLEWNITEINDGTYQILLDGLPDASGGFINEINVTSPANTTIVGDWNYTIIATDPSGNTGTHTVFVHVRDVVIPIIIGPGADFIIEQDSVFNLAWNITDDNNGTYVILRNGLVNGSGSFINGLNVSIAVVTNVTGIWNYTIIATDPSLNNESDTVLIRIYDKDHEIITPGTSQIINKTAEEPGLLFSVNTTDIAFLELITKTTNLIGKGIGTDITALYFYNITIFDTSFNKNNSIIISLTIRFYYNPDLVKKESNVKLLRALYLGGGLWIWENMDITRNETGNYVEFTTTELSIFCLAEIKIPPGKEDNPFLIFLMENMIWIIILAAVGVSVPSIYVVRTKKKKKKQTYDKLTAGKVADLKEKAVLKKETMEKRLLKPDEKIESKDLQIKAKVAPKHKKKKKKKSVLKPVFTTEDKMKIDREIEDTEKELVLEEKLDTCTIHKGAIEGVSYVCPKCHAKYCVNCARSIQDRKEPCWVCETAIKLDMKKDIPIEEISLNAKLPIDIKTISKDEQFERLILNSASVIKIWLFSSQDNKEFFNETLDPEFLTEEEFGFVLPEILKSDYEKDKFHEKAFKIAKQQVYCVIYFSKYLVNMIIVSKNRLDNTYFVYLKDAIENLEEEYMDIKDSFVNIQTLLNEKLNLFLSRQFSKIPNEVNEMLKRIFQESSEYNLVKSEILKLPEDTFTEFLELYGRLTEEDKQLQEKKAEETDYNVD